MRNGRTELISYVENVSLFLLGILFLVGALVIGGVLTSLLSILSLAKIYPLPMAYTHAQTFTPLGSLLDQALYLALLLPLAGYVAWPIFARRKTNHESGEAAPVR